MEERPSPVYKHFDLEDIKEDEEQEEVEEAARRSVCTSVPDIRITHSHEDGKSGKYRKLSAPISPPPANEIRLDLDYTVV